MVGSSKLNNYKSNLDQENWRGLLVFDTIGNSFHLTLREMLRPFTHRYLILFVFFVLTLLVLLNAHDYRSVMPLGSTILLWLICILTLTGLYLAITAGLILASKRYSGLFIYFPVVGLTAMTVNTFLTNYNASIIFGNNFSLDVASSQLPINLAIVFVFEGIFMVFVYPLIRQSTSIPDAPAKPANATVLIAGKRFRTDEIRVISSQDHYIEITTLNGSSMLRARLGDVVDQLSGVDGIMPHRSHWVARDAVDRMTGNASKRVLALAIGSEIPVARGRVAEVRDWLDTHSG